MNVHEYQGKKLLARYGVRTLRGEVATTPEEARQIAEQLGSPVVVVKAQIHAGGRGAGAIVAGEEEAASIFHANLEKEGLPKHDRKGGVRIAKSPADAEAAAREMLGSILVTRQTGPSGRRVHRVFLEEGCDIGRELYLSVLLDRAVGRVAMMASAAGGMDIERVAEETPEKIFRVTVDPAIGLQDYEARKLAFGLGVKEEKIGEWVKFFHGIYDAYMELDCSLVEVNPLVETGDGSLIALDAKVSFDDNALYRHADVRELRDENEEDPKERQAAKFDLSYIALSGNIGCMVNGAGLAMATMDIIHHHGGEPANFCDVGGGATTEKVAEAFKIILSDENVKAVFINIFGGIMQCDVLAKGVVEASRQVGVRVPLVVRLEGTNVEEGRRIIGTSGLNIITAADMADGARKAVDAARAAA
ncbi:MAG TPA: ADP-forming succinate--CoA ligase subunit beta [Candidatus Limnocylindrales bacterium]|nr:ADP-forming succinate--CoA ligase subunit beta [Candidatus Limnocylindrales bacterium]